MNRLIKLLNGLLSGSEKKKRLTMGILCNKEWQREIERLDPESFMHISKPIRLYINFGWDI